MTKMIIYPKKYKSQIILLMYQLLLFYNFNLHVSTVIIKFFQIL